ncbi:MAG: hypothetical protein JOZ69_16935 [Myxococcales bacterium]|nr:hypothetical protein [Myxococcales bacterium]
MNHDFRFTVGSEPEHEDLVGDLYFDDQIVCVLTQDFGFDAMAIDIHAAPGGSAVELFSRGVRVCPRSSQAKDVGTSARRRGGSMMPFTSSGQDPIYVSGNRVVPK